ncbi:MAG: thioredoxin domain-containing protein [Patescibacteria group bacterium]
MKHYIIVAAALVSIVAVGIYIVPRRTPPDTAHDSPVPVLTPVVDGEDVGTSQKTGRYVPYSQPSFDAAADKKRVLFFHAQWCPTCRPADAAFQKEAARIPEGVVLFKTDYDTATELKKKYEVTYQHTFVQVDAYGNAVTKWNGGDLNELIAKVK